MNVNSEQSIEQITSTIQNMKGVLQVDTMRWFDTPEYVAIRFTNRSKQIYIQLISPEDLHLLIDGFSVSVNGSSRIPYVRLRSGKYLHIAISGNTEDGFVTHHVYPDNGEYVLDNRREALQIVDTAEHSRMHRNLRVAANKLKR